MTIWMRRTRGVDCMTALQLAVSAFFCFPHVVVFSEFMMCSEFV